MDKQCIPRVLFRSLLHNVHSILYSSDFAMLVDAPLIFILSLQSTLSLSLRLVLPAPINTYSAYFILFIFYIRVAVCLVSWAFARIGVHRPSLRFPYLEFSIRSYLPLNFNRVSSLRPTYRHPFGRPFSYSLFR